MSLAEGATLMGRSWAESLMTSACTITRGDPHPVLNESTGEYVQVPTRIYPASDSAEPSGPCKIKFGATEPTQVDAQGQLLVEQVAILSLPVESSGDVTTDDLATITACTLDPSLVGKVFRISGLHTQTAATQRRFPVEVVSGG